METIGSKRSYALTWCMPNNDDDDDGKLPKLSGKIRINFHIEISQLRRTCMRELWVCMMFQSHLSDHHESMHSCSRSFVCDVCGSSFKTRAVHRKHLLTIHSQPGQHLCTACGRTFNTGFAMKRHARMHQLQMSCVDIAARQTTTTLPLCLPAASVPPSS